MPMRSSDSDVYPLLFLVQCQIWMLRMFFFKLRDDVLQAFNDVVFLHTTS